MNVKRVRVFLRFSVVSDSDTNRDGCTLRGDLRKDLQPAADRVRPGRPLIVCGLAAAAEDLPVQLAMPARLDAWTSCGTAARCAGDLRKVLRPAAVIARTSSRLARVVRFLCNAFHNRLCLPVFPAGLHIGVLSVAPPAGLSVAHLGIV